MLEVNLMPGWWGEDQLRSIILYTIIIMLPNNIELIILSGFLV